MNRSLTTALRRIVSRKMKINSTVMSDITPSGYIMNPPFARISRKLDSLTADAGASGAADAMSAVRKNPATEKWQHFMKVWESSDGRGERKPGQRAPDLRRKLRNFFTRRSRNPPGSASNAGSVLASTATARGEETVVNFKHQRAQAGPVGL